LPPPKEMGPPIIGFENPLFSSSRGDPIWLPEPTYFTPGYSTSTG
jgi:hypothetical protein